MNRRFWHTFLNISMTPIHTKKQIIKKHTCESQNTWHNFFAHCFSKNIFKSILTNLKIRGTIFLLMPFSNIKKSILTNLKIRGTIFLLIAFLKIFSKAYLRISKYMAQFFCSSPFQILKKAYF